jgi:hypothetical protein
MKVHIFICIVLAEESLQRSVADQAWDLGFCEYRLELSALQQLVTFWVKYSVVH